jgi:hypothetical protein
MSGRLLLSPRDGHRFSSGARRSGSTQTVAAPDLCVRRRCKKGSSGELGIVAFRDRAIARPRCSFSTTCFARLFFGIFGHITRPESGRIAPRCRSLEHGHVPIVPIDVSSQPIQFGLGIVGHEPPSFDALAFAIVPAIAAGFQRRTLFECGVPRRARPRAGVWRIRVGRLSPICLRRAGEASEERELLQHPTVRGAHHETNRAPRADNRAWLSRRLRPSSRSRRMSRPNASLRTAASAFPPSAGRRPHCGR